MSLIKKYKTTILLSFLFLSLLPFSSMADENNPGRFRIIKYTNEGSDTGFVMLDTSSGNIWFTTLDMIGESQKRTSENRGKYWYVIPGPNDNNVLGASLDSSVFDQLEANRKERKKQNLTSFDKAKEIILERGKQENKESLQ